MNVSQAAWSIRVGTRYVFGKKGKFLARFFPPACAIALSVMTIVMVLNVSNGMIRGIITKFTETGIYHIRATSDQLYGSQELAAIRQQLLSHPFIERVGFEYDTISLLSARNMRQGVSVRAISEEIWKDDHAFREHINVEAGELLLSSPSDIMIGSYLAEQMGIGVEERVELISFRRVDGVVIPRIRTYRVRGIFSVGYRDLDRIWVLIPFEHSQQSVYAGAARTIIGVKVVNPFALPNPILKRGDIALASDALRSVERYVGDDFNVRTWFQLHVNRFLAFRSTKNILLFIMVLIIAVAMLHLISALNSLAVEKKSEIAYLKCIGASEYQIRAIFAHCGFCIGIGGASIGIMLGLLASIHINQILSAVEYSLALFQRLFTIEYGISLALLRREIYLEEIPVILSRAEIMLIFSVTLFFAIAAAIFVAKKHARISPMQILSDTY